MAKWDWDGFAFPKGEAKPTATEGRDITGQVFARQRFICFAQGISPVCTGRCEDPHELVSRGAGGRKSLTNTVGVCRACHNAAQGKVGGIRLKFDWVGRKDGAKPRADLLGNVSCRWVGRKVQASGADVGNAGSNKDGGQVQAGPATTAAAATTETERLPAIPAGLAQRRTERGGDRDNDGEGRRQHERHSEAVSARSRVRVHQGRRGR